MLRLFLFFWFVIPAGNLLLPLLLFLPLPFGVAAVFRPQKRAQNFLGFSPGPFAMHRQETQG
jgi:hypothetical protein